MKIAGISSRRFGLPASRCRSRGFTLIEIMVVVAILGIVMTIGIPVIGRSLKRAPLIETVKEIREVCSQARARAIIGGATTQVVFRPFDRTFSISGGAASGAGAKWGGNSTTSGTIDDRLTLEMLDVNLMEFKDQPLAVVNFYPNGTADELTIVLSSEDNQWRKINLEVTTGLTTVENLR